ATSRSRSPPSGTTCSACPAAERPRPRSRPGGPRRSRPRRRPPGAAEGARLVPGQVDVELPGLARAKADLAPDDTVARSHHLDPVRTRGELQLRGLPSGAAEPVVDVDRGAGRPARE